MPIHIDPAGKADEIALGVTVEAGIVVAALFEEVHYRNI